MKQDLDMKRGLYFGDVCRDTLLKQLEADTRVSSTVVVRGQC